MISREEALKLLKEHVKTDYLIKHCIATEAIMKALAERLGGDPEKWAVAGLLHDLDFEETKDEPEKHSLKTEEILRNMDIEEDMIQAIKAHNAEGIGIERKSTFDYALTCAESVTGLIVATALVYPDKKLAGVKAKSIIKRMKKKDFARKVSRERIKDCAGAGLELQEFIEIALKAMQSVSDDLGL